MALTDLDRIARDICWLSQTPRRRAGKRKGAFWLSLTDDAREGYRAIGRRFAKLLRALPEDTVNLAHQLRGRI